jgi:polyisoprenoid-binding protein YceI
MMKREVVAADASVVIKRTEFNAGKYAPYVGDDVTITIAIEAIKN